MHSLPEALAYATIDERLREAERQRLITRAIAVRRQRRRAARESRRNRQSSRELPPQPSLPEMVVYRHSS